jgi:hypothetical protein
MYISYGTTQQMMPLYKVTRFWLSQERDDVRRCSVGFLVQTYGTSNEDFQLDMVVILKWLILDTTEIWKMLKTNLTNIYIKVKLVLYLKIYRKAEIKVNQVIYQLRPFCGFRRPHSTKRECVLLHRIWYSK